MFPLPTITFNALTIKLYRDTDTEIWSKSASPTSAQTLNRGDILNLPEVTAVYEDPDETYYLAGWLNGDGVWTKNNAYKFVDGTLTVTIGSNTGEYNYAAIVDGNNARYTFGTYVEDGTESVLYKRNGDWENEKMRFPQNKEVTFTLKDNGYDANSVHMLKLSYTVSD